jgi:hypothetical protein
MKTRLFITMAAFVAMTAIAAAQTTDTTTGQTGKGRAAGNTFVDADNDGVCDNYENGTRPGRRAYSAGENQAAANRGPGRGQGLGQGKRNGQGRSMGMASGRGYHQGQGPAFVDANKDGVCDNLQTTVVKK